MTTKHEKVECQFDAYCKICLKLIASNKRRKIKASSRDLHIEDLPSTLQAGLILNEEPLIHHFNVGTVQQQISIRDGQLAAALERLPETKRTIVLLSYLLGYSDSAIASMLGMKRVTVHYQRHKSLEYLKSILEEMIHEADI